MNIVFLIILPPRVTADHGKSLAVFDGVQRRATISGRLEYEHEAPDLQKVGDWVSAQSLDDSVIIHDVLFRRIELARKSAGTKIQKQVLATSVDLAFIVQALDGDLNMNRLKRYLFQIKQPNICPIIIYNKIDKNNN